MHLAEYALKKNKFYKVIPQNLKDVKDCACMMYIWDIICFIEGQYIHTAQKERKQQFNLLAAYFLLISFDKLIWHEFFAQMNENQLENESIPSSKIDFKQHESVFSFFVFISHFVRKFRF